MKWIVALVALLVALDLGMAYIRHLDGPAACDCKAACCSGP